jgi:hypothetical protein
MLTKRPTNFKVMRKIKYALMGQVIDENWLKLPFGKRQSLLKSHL